MSNFLQRLVTGFILISLFVCCVLLSQATYIALIMLISTLGLLEFYRLFEPAEIHSRKMGGVLLSISTLTSFALSADGFVELGIFLIIIPVAYMLFIYELYSKQEKPFHNLAFTFLGVLYISVPAAFLILIPFFPFGEGLYHPYKILGYFFIVWACDSGAYGVGKLFGRHPLFKRISPGKTWEGSIGGAFSAFIMAFIVSRFAVELTLQSWMTIAFIVLIAGTYGDLIKSMMKRSLNIKDSGKILPGHGGILDRFDAMFSAAPFVFIYIYLA